MMDISAFILKKYLLCDYSNEAVMDIYAKGIHFYAGSAVYELLFMNSLGGKPRYFL
jgi:hypothetical protein